MNAIARSGLLVWCLAALGCGTAATVCGCLPDECERTLECADAVPAPTCVADPASGRAEDACGVFVSSSRGDDTDPGTRERPVRTIERAITLARSGPRRVYACAEVFPEAAVLPSGVDLWGGLDCARDWVYLGGDSRTVLAPEPDRIPLRVDGGEGISTIADVQLEAADALLPGGSSIAALVLPGASVEVLRSKLLAGDGAPGAPGEAGGDGPATAGATGWAGGPACSANTIPGGPAVVTSCGDQESAGGEGGEGSLSAGGSGTDGQPAPTPNPMGWGKGGSGESGLQCVAGEAGLNGDDGQHGYGARGPGRITLDGWDGRRGQDGRDGLPGQGGGGGGGSRGGSLYCGVGAETPKGGASGGSGGGGGCGGKGGKGGGYGGASIGLVSFSGDVTLTATSIAAGNGGDGGAGGLAQIGGAQGAPGSGGASVNGSHPGCWGGVGGKGGNGGHGGGGLGGASLGVAHLLGQPPAMYETGIKTGAPGKGGPGGNQAVIGSVGEDGTQGDTLGFPQ